MRTGRTNYAIVLGLIVATGLAAVAVRPLGPAAAEASAPSLILLPINDSAPRGFTTSRTKSVACAPS